MTQGITRRGLAAMALGSLAAGPAIAQTPEWPQRPLRVVVPYGAGGATDTQARIFSQRLATILGQGVAVENRPGANTAIGAEQVLRAPRDGHTLMFAAGGAILAAPRMQPLTYDPLRDFTGISVVGSNTTMLSVHRDFPARNLAEFLAYARANPGRLNAGNTGNGASSHLAAVMLAQQANIDIVHVAYPGVPQVLTDLITNRIQLTMGSPADMLPQASAGTLRVLAVTGEGRARQLPDVPALSETIPGSTFLAWNAFFAPTGTPRPVIEVLARHLAAIAREPEVIRRLDELGIDADGSTPEGVATMIRREDAEYERLLRASGLRRAG
jgi:tripartite-type tricarboxylate transporter receptor subunit TctC